MSVAGLIGRFDVPEAEAVAAELPAIVPGAQIYRFVTPTDAARFAGAPADLVVVVQHRPAEFSRREAGTLLGAFPLARFVIGLGPWCASHGRSERLWPEAMTVPLRDVPSRLRREACRLSSGEPPLPLTASREETILAVSAARETARPAPAAAVISSDRSYAAVLGDLLRQAGAVLVEGDRASVVCFDADPLHDDQLRRLSELRARRPAARVVAVTAFVEASEATRLRRAGADAVLAKPFFVGDLTAALEGMAG